MAMKWTDEKIERTIRKVQSEFEELDSETMPTKRQIIQALGSSGLAIAIARKGGFDHWAKKLGLKKIYSKSQRGYLFEKMAVELLKEKTGYVFELTPHKHPYDLEFEEVKIDVKVSGRSYSGAHRTTYNYTFHDTKNPPTCDFFMMFCNNENVVEKVLIVPAYALKDKTGIGVGKNSAYDIFKDRYDLIINDVEAKESRRLTLTEKFDKARVKVEEKRKRGWRK